MGVLDSWSTLDIRRLVGKHVCGRDQRDRQRDLVALDGLAVGRSLASSASNVSSRACGLFSLVGTPGGKGTRERHLDGMYVCVVVEDIEVGHWYMWILCARDEYPWLVTLVEDLFRNEFVNLLSFDLRSVERRIGVVEIVRKWLSKRMFCRQGVYTGTQFCGNKASGIRLRKNDCEGLS